MADLDEDGELSLNLSAGGVLSKNIASLDGVAFHYPVGTSIRHADVCHIINTRVIIRFLN
jgi:hypothetical protein